MPGDGWVEHVSGLPGWRAVHDWRVGLVEEALVLLDRHQRREQTAERAERMFGVLGTEPGKLHS